MPSISILCAVVGPGDGGGVSSYVALPLFLGRSANETTFTEDDVVDERGREGEVGDVDSEMCDRLIFLDGGG